MKQYIAIFVSILMLATNLRAENKDNLPTIQEAWVDAGYFMWKDSTKTSLHITELGAKQEILPDVRDGEQLTDASFMFATFSDSDTRNCKLTKAPMFNTSNITSFYGMFLECYDLVWLPIYNTSKGINFARMFSGCVSLKTIPLLNTSRGQNFNNMFANDLLLEAIPKLNTSQGLNFSFMFFRCHNLTHIPYLNLSKGSDLSYMFFECKTLKSKPKLIVAKGADKDSMYAYTRFDND